MLANFLIGLREGLEAALIIGILVAYLAKTDRSKAIPQVMAGVAFAIVVAIAVGLVLTVTVANVEGGLNQIIGGTTSIIAVAFVTWMVFWMKSQSRGLGAELRGKVDATSTATFGLVAIAFVAVIREGIETSIFLWSAARATAEGDNPVIGAVLGIVLAGVLGYFSFKGALRINLSKFFRYTGIFLIVVSAGILAYAVSEFEEIITLPLQNHTYDVSAVLPNGSPVEAVLHGLISFNPTPTLLQTLVWFGYLIPVTVLYLRTEKAKSAAQ